MLNYVIRRLILLPVTLFFIILINFVIVNLAPGDPVTTTESAIEGATRRQDRSVAFGSDDRYLQFREFYGLTLPILFNTWPWITQKEVEQTLHQLVKRKNRPEDSEEMPLKQYDELRIQFGDQARFIMPKLLKVATDNSQPISIRQMASRFFVRGGTRQAILGPDLSEADQAYNKKISVDNQALSQMVLAIEDNPAILAKKEQEMQNWYAHNVSYYELEPTESQKWAMFFFETRFFRYLSRVLRLDFGTLRNDSNKTVISEVVKRFKYSLTLAVIPMFVTFVLCFVLGLIMAYYQNQWPDIGLNLIFLVLYAIPVFVVAPFLIQLALHRDFPLTHTPIPTSGFTSPPEVFDQLNSFEQIVDILKHISLPLIAVMYGSLAAQARLSRTAILEVLRQDYVRTAQAKGASTMTTLFKHVGRNASITIVTSIAGSLGVVLGGSLIVETLFEINGFGKFFYDAIVNRDYNVIMFSALAGSFLTLMGYLVADIAYTLLDPRLTLE